MAKDITKIISSLRTTAVNGCRERLGEVAVRSRDLTGSGGNSDEKGAAPDEPEYGVTHLLKFRHGL